jgi:hypothetical protein
VREQSERQKDMTSTAEHFDLQIICDGHDIFVILPDGLRIARRGYPGTAQARTWVPLEPGWSVVDTADGGGNEIEYKAVGTQ